jgi:hypothetical protein
MQTTTRTTPLTVVGPRGVDEVVVVGRERRVDDAPADVPRADRLRQVELAARRVVDADVLVCVHIIDSIYIYIFHIILQFIFIFNISLFGWLGQP